MIKDTPCTGTHLCCLWKERAAQTAAELQGSLDAHIVKCSLYPAGSIEVTTSTSIHVKNLPARDYFTMLLVTSVSPSMLNHNVVFLRSVCKATEYKPREQAMNTYKVVDQIHLRRKSHVERHNEVHPGSEEGGRTLQCQSISLRHLPKCRMSSRAGHTVTHR